MSPIDHELLSDFLRNALEGRNDPNEWETGHVTLSTADGQSVEGFIDELAAGVVTVDTGVAKMEVSLKEIVDLQFQVESPGPE